MILSRDLTSSYNLFKTAVYALVFFLLICSLAFLAKNIRYDDFKREAIVFHPNNKNQNIVFVEGWDDKKNLPGSKSILSKGKTSKLRIFIKDVNTFYVELRLKVRNNSENPYSEQIHINGKPLITYQIGTKIKSWKKIPVFFTIPKKNLNPGWNMISILHSAPNPDIAFEKIKLLNHRGYSKGFIEAYILLDDAKYEHKINGIYWPVFTDIASLTGFFVVLFIILFPFIVIFTDLHRRIFKYYFFSIIAGLTLLTVVTLFSSFTIFKIILTESSIHNLLILPIIIIHLSYIYKHSSRIKLDFLSKCGISAINHMKQSQTIKNEFIFACLVLMLFLSLFFHRSILFGEINSASGLLQYSKLFRIENFDKVDVNSLWGDPLEQTEPWRFILARSLENKEFPLWNSLNSGGIPHMANMQSSVLYPLNYFYYFFNMKFATFLFYFLKLFIIGIFTYSYLRELSFYRYTSIIGSIVFMFCGFNMVWLYWAHTNVIFFLPASLLIIERAFKAKQTASIIKYFIVYSLLFAFAFFGGHPETLTHILVFTSFYFLHLLFSSNKELINRVKITAIFIGANIAGTLLSMIQLLPFLEYLSLSEKLMLRSSIEKAEGAVFYPGFILNIIPDFYGNQTFGKLLPYYADPISNYNESGGGYIGLFMIVFAFLGIKYFFKDKKITFLWVMVMFLCGVIYGIYPFSNIFNSLPIFKLAANQRMLFLVAFIFLVIGCKTFNDYLFWDKEIKSKDISILFIIMILMIIYLGSSIWKLFPLHIQEWEDNIVNIIRTQIITILVWLLAFICVRWLILNGKEHRYKTLILFIIPLFIFLETGIHGIFYVPTVKNKNFYPENHLTNKIKSENSGHYRSTAIGVFSPPNVNVAYNISDIRNYDAINILKYKEFINYMFDSKREDFLEINDVNSTLLNLMGVKYIITDSQEMQENYKLVMENSEKNIFLFANSTVFKRAYIAKKYTVIKNDLIILESIKNKKLDLSEEVILEEYPPVNFSNPLNKEDHAAQTTITTYKSNLVRIKTNSEKEGFLVLSDNYFPGWKAFIDGERTKIYRANYTFRAVHIPGGSHEVTFKYDPLSFKIGLYITIFSLILLSTVFAYVTLKGKKSGFL